MSSLRTSVDRANETTVTPGVRSVIIAKIASGFRENGRKTGYLNGQNKPTPNLNENNYFLKNNWSRRAITTVTVAAVIANEIIKSFFADGCHLGLNNMRFLSFVLNSDPTRRKRSTTILLPSILFWKWISIIRFFGSTR